MLGLTEKQCLEKNRLSQELCNFRSTQPLCEGHMRHTNVLPYPHPSSPVNGTRISTTASPCNTLSLLHSLHVS